MLTTPIDNLNFINDPEIKSILPHEDIYYTEKLTKITQGLFSPKQERNIIITDRAFYNLKGKVIKRKIDIRKLTGITISKINEQFLIHGKEDEYDYLFTSPNRLKIIEILEIIYEYLTQNELLFCIKNEKNLMKFLVGEKERKAQPDLFKIAPEELMSIREYIESGGDLNINSHPKTFLLEPEFNKNKKYKNESLSNFEIISIIGKGKTATIYLAKYEGKNVALKVFDKIYLYKNNLIEKIALEKEILCSFNEEKFLCHMLFYFTTQTKIIFVLPFFPGGDLYNLLLIRNKFDETTVAFFSEQIAHMISFLHSKNIVYRDLKLENIMLNENGYLTMIDFGSCKVIEDEKELESSFVGSIDYVSPEMISGDGHSFSTDWWSYGILIYELLFGIPPFHDDKIERIIELILSSNIRFPSNIKISNGAKDIIIKLLERNKGNRFGSGGFNQIVQHEFFKSINVKNVLIQKTSPPLKPICPEDNPLANFDNLYVSLPSLNIETAADLSKLNEINPLLKEFEE